MSATGSWGSGGDEGRAPCRELVLTSHQPAYLPWAGLFHKIALADCFVHLETVQFSNPSFINRNRIRLEDKAHWLTVPVITSAKTTQPIVEVAIDNRRPWRRKHWSAICHAYAKAPYFETYAPALQSIYEREWDQLTELNLCLLRTLLDALDIRTPLIRSGTLALHGHKNQLILSICQELGATSFWFGEGGLAYAQPELFQRHGVTARFQRYRHPIYDQGPGGEFVPYLSVIDLLFRAGPRSREIIMASNVDRDGRLPKDGLPASQLGPHEGRSLCVHNHAAAGKPIGGVTSP